MVSAHDCTSRTVYKSKQWHLVDMIAQPQPASLSSLLDVPVAIFCLFVNEVDLRREFNTPNRWLLHWLEPVESEVPLVQTL
jgi:hypothetical protein